MGVAVISEPVDDQYYNCPVKLHTNKTRNTHRGRPFGKVSSFVVRLFPDFFFFNICSILVMDLKCFLFR